MKFLFLFQDKISYEIISKISLCMDVEIDLISESDISYTFYNPRFRYLGQKKDISNFSFDIYDVFFDFSASDKDTIKWIFKNIKFKQYILRSTYLIYKGMNKKSLIEEDDTESLNNSLHYQYFLNSKLLNYAKLKVAYENIVIEECNIQKIPYHVLRFSKIYADCDQFNDISWIAQMILSENPILIPQNILLTQGYINPIYVNDIISLLSYLVDLGISVESGIYNIAQDEILSFYDFVNYISCIYNKKINFAVLPFELLKFEVPPKVPIFENLVISNQKSKSTLFMKYSKSKDWLRELCPKNIPITTPPPTNADLLSKYNALLHQLSNLKIIKGNK